MSDKGSRLAGNTGRRILRKIALFAASMLLLAAVIPASASPTHFAIPGTYRLAGWEHLGDGLDHISIRRDGAVNAQAINVARLEPGAPFQLRAVVSTQSVGGGVEKTSSMCQRLRCLAGINGDFFMPSNGQPVGGLSIFGQAIRSPDRTRPQLQISNGRLSVANESWHGRFTFSDQRGITIDGVNIPLRGGKITLYTAAWGQTTGNKPGVTELGIQIVKPKGPLVLGRDSMVRFVTTRHTGDAPIPGSGLILAGEGSGAAALDMLWGDMTHERLSPRAAVQINSTSKASDSVGGAPVLLRDGQRAFTIVDRELITARHPRSIVGWNPLGETFIVSVDGRQPGYADGMTLVEAADLMKSMGATDAINLDGGGSTTFVTRGGRIANQPSDVIVERKGRRMEARVAAANEPVLGRIERSVATALVIVAAPLSKPAVKRAASPSPASHGLYGAKFLPLRDEPAVMLHALAAEPADTSRSRRLDVLAFMLVAAVGTGVTGRLRRQWRLRGSR